jgi:hypothetical protein
MQAIPGPRRLLPCGLSRHARLPRPYTSSAAAAAASVDNEAASARAEEVIADLEESLADKDSLAERLQRCDAELRSLSVKIDSTYSTYFDLDDVELEDGSMRSFHDMTEARMQELGKGERAVRSRYKVYVSRFCPDG